MATRRKRKTATKAAKSSKRRTRAGARSTAAGRRSARSGTGAGARASKKAAGRATRKAPARSAASAAATNATPEEQKFLKRYAGALSRTTQRAKWIHSPEEHEDRAGQSLATRSHDVIRHWAEERRAAPATIEGTDHDGRPGVLRFNFPGFGQGGRLKEIGWKDWFRSFDDRELVFLFQEHKRDGKQSNFFRFDSPRRERA